MQQKDALPFHSANPAIKCVHPLYSVKVTYNPCTVEVYEPLMPHMQGLESGHIRLFNSFIHKQSLSVAIIYLLNC